MDFHKVETTSNFVFGPPPARDLILVDHGSSVFRLTWKSDRWPRGTDSHAVLSPGEFAGEPSRASLTVGPGGEAAFSWGGQPLLVSAQGRGFGVCGPKWVLAFRYHPEDRFYGMGQKHLGLELSNKRTKFWNTDELGDFPFPVLEDGAPDPSYASFPVLIVKHHDLWAAVIVDNPHCVFFNTGAPEPIFQEGAAPFVPELYLGARDGEADLWFLADETPGGLVRKIQALQGRPALPPVWALGHQQCRWGYRSYDDLKRIADRYEAEGIPNDGLWLDIDYMDGFRVFTVDGRHFDDVKARLAELAARGHRVVPILDPGFRQDNAYRVYAEAKAADLLCRNPEGRDYVGFVWPGYTVFPDFSLPETRKFWAKEVEAFTGLGFGGYWIDMNDPATGSVPHEDMRFGRGTLPHSAYHNQYALGMAQATKAGLEAARPGERPFVITRSAYLSSSRYTAQWTGDNISNEHNMRGAITMVLNMSVSGMPFAGPDVPGFVKDATAELMRLWYKLGFLFPFLRNHKVQDGADQEPWTRDAKTTRIVGDYIRLRYKLLPYLYQVFQGLAATGDPVLRPVWYHDPSPSFDRTDDAFFVGPSILQAPFTKVTDKTRTVTLPRHAGGTGWYDVQNQKFVTAGSVTRHRNTPETTPVFLASGSALPLQRGVRRTNRNDFAALDVLLVLEEGQTSVLDYRLDDGLTISATHSRYRLTARLDQGRVTVSSEALEKAFGPISVRFLLLCPFPRPTLACDGQDLGLKAEALEFAGSRVRVAASQEIAL
jgi:alpha-glucosidase